MKKLLAIILFLFAFNAYSQNTVTLPTPTISITPSWRIYGTLTDTLREPWMQTPGGGWNRIYTATESNLKFLPINNQGTIYKVWHGNASGAGSFGFVDLTTDVSNNLPQSQVAGLSDSLSAKLNKVDTADMLLPYINKVQKGANNGVATLDGGGKVPLAQLPANLLVYKGQWNQVTNTPTLANGTGTAGDTWEASQDTTVSVNFGAGTVLVSQGDFAIYNGSQWQVVGGIDRVLSVNGQQGIVDLNTDDISEGSTNKYFTNARAIGSTLTGYTSGAGAISSSDNILQAIQKLNGNIGGLGSIYELLANKATTYATVNNTLYPTIKLVSDSTLHPNKNFSDVANKPLSLNNLTGATVIDARVYATLNAAVTAIGSNKVTLNITNPIGVSSNLTMPSNISIQVSKGGDITTNGHTLTINGVFNSGRYRVFHSAVGEITLNAGSIQYQFPEWDGAANDGTLGDTTTRAFAIQVARDLPINISNGNFLVDSIASNSNGSPLVIFGLDHNIVGPPGAKITLTAKARMGISIGGVTSTNNSKLSDFELVGNSTNVGGISLGSSSSYVGTTILIGLKISGFTGTSSYGIALKEVQNLHIIDVNLQNNYWNYYRPDFGYCTSTLIDGSASYIGTATNRGVNLLGSIDDITFQGVTLEGNANEAIYYNKKYNSTIRVLNCYLEANSTGGNGTISIIGDTTANYQTKLILQNCYFHANSNASIPQLYLQNIKGSSVSNNTGIGGIGNIVTNSTAQVDFYANGAGNGEDFKAYYNALSGQITAEDRDVNGKWFTLGKTEVNQGTTSTVKHGNASGYTSYSQIVNSDIANSTIDLTTKVTGLLADTNINSVAWSKITSTPITIGSYGITDFNSLGDARWLQTSGFTTSAINTLYGYTPANGANYLPLAGGALTGTLYSSVTSGAVFQADNATTGYLVSRMLSSNARIDWGIEGNTGGDILTGTAPNSVVFNNVKNTPMVWGVDNSIKMTLLPSGMLGIGYPIDPTSGNILAWNGNSYGNGNGVFTGNLSAANLSGTNTGDQTITLTGDVTGSGTGSFATTLTNSSVIGQLLTGYASGAGTISSSDNILQAIQKLNGNIAGLNYVTTNTNQTSGLSGNKTWSGSTIFSGTTTFNNGSTFNSAATFTNNLIISYPHEIQFNNSGATFSTVIQGSNATANRTILLPDASGTVALTNNIPPALNYNHTIFVPTTGSTITAVNNQYNIINPGGSILALTINTPASPANGDVVMLKFIQQITTVTYSGTGGSTVYAPASGSINGYVILTYDTGTNSWY